MRPELGKRTAPRQAVAERRELCHVSGVGEEDPLA